MNSTVQDNILFGLPMDPKRYKEVLRACSLTRDLEVSGHLGMRGMNCQLGRGSRATKPEPDPVLWLAIIF